MTSVTSVRQDNKKRVTHQTEKGERTASAHGNMQTQAPQRKELHLMYSAHWRLALFLCGMTPAILTAIGLAKSDERFSWAGWAFIYFGGVCLFGGAAGNPRNLTKPRSRCTGWQNYLYICFCGVITGASNWLVGLVLVNREDEATVQQGEVCLFMGLLFVVTMPPAYISIISIYAKMSDKALSNAVTNLFKSLPHISGSCLFVSAASLRCITSSQPDLPIIEQCGNPLIPSFMICNFLVLSWVMGIVILPFRFDGSGVFTWGNLMMMKMSRHDLLKFSLFLIASVLTLVVYAGIDEDGSKMSPLMSLLVNLLTMDTFVLVFILVYEYVFLPHCCRNDKWGDGDDGEKNSDAFEFGAADEFSVV